MGSSVIEIIRKHLEENGYDGLVHPGQCSCSIDDQNPCEHMNLNECKPGYIIQCNHNCADYEQCLHEHKDAKCDKVSSYENAVMWVRKVVEYKGSCGDAEEDTDLDVICICCPIASEGCNGATDEQNLRNAHAYLSKIDGNPRPLTVSSEWVLSLVSCADDYGFNDDVLMDAFAQILDGRLSDKEIEYYARSVANQDGYTEEDFECITNRLNDFRSQYCERWKKED